MNIGPIILTEMDLIMLQRLIISLALGFFIGFLRRKRAAGIRTFTLICIGCTLFTLISIDPLLGENVDKSRIISSIVSGIGFLGLGVIWKNDSKVQGLTTAATVWTTAAIGIEVGIGNYFIALIGAIIVGAVLMSKHLIKNEEKVAKRLIRKIKKRV